MKVANMGPSKTSAYVINRFDSKIIGDFSAFFNERDIMRLCLTSTIDNISSTIYNIS